MRQRDHHQLTERIEEVVRLVRSGFAEEADHAARFAEIFLGGVIHDDIEGMSIENLYGEVASLWQFFRHRRAGGAKVRVFDPDPEEDGWQSTHTVIEIVNDDMPFLVDSVVAALNVLGVPVLLLIHPVIHVTRDDEGTQTGIGSGLAESVLHVEITQQPVERHREIVERLHHVLGQVRAAVEDWRPMVTCLERHMTALETAPPPVSAGELDEGLAFLKWLLDDHFTFLGYREYRFERRDGEVFAHIVEGENRGILREVTEESRKRHEQALPEHFVQYLESRELFIISKAWTRSDVHRPVFMDYVGLRRFSDAGEVVGECRFLGLLTSTAYNTSPSQIPLLRRKVAMVMERSGATPGSHNAKALGHILDTFPRDELFQIDVDTLEAFSRGILHLEHRQRIRLFLRRDSYGQFVSCLVYIPRERYSTDLRRRMEAILLEELNGNSVDVQTQVSDAPMARAQFIVHTPDKDRVEGEPAAIERRLTAASRTWDDNLHDALTEEFGEGRGAVIFHRYRPAIPGGYKEMFSTRLAVADIQRMEAMGDGDIAMNLYRRVDAAEGDLNFKVYHRGTAVPLSGIMPMLEHMGLVVIEEAPYEIRPDDGTVIWIHDFRVQLEHGWTVDVAEVRQRFHETFARVWSGEVEDDDFNNLVLVGLGWRQVVVLRAYAKYLMQINAPFSQAYVEQTMAANPAIARLLVDLFETRFDPDKQARAHVRGITLRERILEALDGVESLDQDRILRRYLNLIEVTLRTNFYQTDADGAVRPYVAFKFDSQTIHGLPEPRPWREIFVYSTRVEAVHLRGGPVARGGIRWSDRLEDFRTEVLGLVKAQMVKNAVIVPVGSKGGFVVKRPPPASAGRDAQQAEGIACYQTFMAGMLDVTDNISGGHVVTRERLVRRDDDDPYLVVAADKGTATFSDIANDVAASYGHWLGDAFASGGSAGYDHKTMAITAKGAWEAVRRHFREIGKDVDCEDFTVIGIGDMMGDVFGNGMLLSRHIRLVGAFNHMHIFIDPEPDAETSWEERKRLFDLPRSTWADYDTACLSEGGAIYDRSAKSISLSPQGRKALGIAEETLTPAELIHAMLKADVELLWNGGIGTYIKAAHESNASVGDRANDGVRVNGRQVGARVVGEGGNLGATQAGRIEYALAGGRINTDAIDNSGGVDCSDHEVNIKILLGDVVEAGDMTIKQRDRLLEKMTGEVAGLVLRSNYLQTQALSVAEAQGPALTEELVRLMRVLEHKGLLDRRIEGLPDDEELGEWRSRGRHFTRPELAVLLAWAKMDLYAELLDSDLPDDPDLQDDLVTYFPGLLRRGHRERILDHRLRREIVATTTTNSIINRAGITFVRRLAEETGHELADIARAYTVARDSFSLREVWIGIETLDNQVPAQVQSAMLNETTLLIERVTVWMLHHRQHPMAIGETTHAFRPQVMALKDNLPDLVSKRRRKSIRRAYKRFAEEGVPDDIAAPVANLRTLASACDVIETANVMEVDVIDAATVFFEVGETFGADWMRDALARLPVDNRWDRLAQQALVEDSYLKQRRISLAVLGTGEPASAATARWIRDNQARVARAGAIMNDLRSTDSPGSFAMASVAARALASLAE